MAKNDSGNVMVPLDTAYELVDGMRAKFYDHLPREKISIDDSLSRRLASDIISIGRSPSRHISTMDGYAVKAGEPYPLQLIGEVYAGDMPEQIGTGKTVYITTGAALPEGADAVLRIEDAKPEWIEAGGNVLFRAMLAKANELPATFKSNETVAVA